MDESIQTLKMNNETTYHQDKQTTWEALTKDNPEFLQDQPIIFNKQGISDMFSAIFDIAYNFGVNQGILAIKDSIAKQQINEKFKPINNPLSNNQW